MTEVSQNQKQFVPVVSQDRQRMTWAGSRPTGLALELLVFCGLLVSALAISRNYLNSSLFAWGDHPGQFMRFWYPLTHAMGESGHWLWGILSWNPTWYAGYPELQFYPPGTTLLGIFLNYLTFGQLSPEQNYNLLPALAFCLPLFTCYVFMRYVLAGLGRFPSIVGGLMAGFLAISLKPMWGGIDGVVIGLMGERLAFAFAPLVLLAGWWFVEKPSTKRLALAALALAWLLLLHPFHAPALVVAITLYGLARQPWCNYRSSAQLLGQLGEKALWLVAWLLLSISLVAWWVVPLLAHYTPYAAALVRATPEQVLTWFDAGRIDWLWRAGIVAFVLFGLPNARIRVTVGVLALLAPLLAGGILFNDRVLVARLNITFLDPIRFIAEYYLALILVASCAVAAITSGFLWRRSWRVWRVPWLALVCTVVVGFTMQHYLELAWSDLREHVAVPPSSHLKTMQANPSFTGYWEALRDDPARGRIYFVSNYLQLTDEDGVVTPTTINSLTPYLLDREIIGGTFSHWSPVARWQWVGNARAGLLPAQVESGDNQHLFGKSWDEMTGEELTRIFNRLNVTTIVVGASEQKASDFFASSPQFTRYWQNEAFTIYHLSNASESWLDAQGATVALVERSARRWVIDVQQSDANATLLLKMSHYPLWRASINGQIMQIEATEDGLQEITLPAGGPYRIEVNYQEGTAEWLGLVLSLACLLLLIAVSLVPRKSRVAESSPKTHAFGLENAPSL